MATVNISYQGTGTSITLSGETSLADGSYCSSALVDNAPNKYVDALVNGSIQTGGTLTADGQFNIYLVGSADGVEFTGGVSAGAGAITWGTTGQTTINSHMDMHLVYVANVDSAETNTDIPFGPFSVAQYFGGVMPVEWAVVIENQTNGTTHATGTNNHLEYTGIEYDSV